MMGLRRCTLLLTGTAVVAGLLALPAQGAGQHRQVVDATGDARGGQAAYDIVSAEFTTTGVTTRVQSRGRWVTTYVPTSLVVTLRLAGPPSWLPGAMYTVRADVEGCGRFELDYALGVVNDHWVTTDCGGSVMADGSRRARQEWVRPRVTGNQIIWSLPLKSLPPEIRPGVTFSKFEALTDLRAVGRVGTRLVPGGIDRATGDGSWQLGSRQ